MRQHGTNQNVMHGYIPTPAKETLRYAKTRKGLNHMRSAIGYDRVPVQYYRPVIKVTPDYADNVGRSCSYQGSDRVWRIRVSMRDQEFKSWYLIQNRRTGERVIAHVDTLHYLY